VVSPWVKYRPIRCNELPAPVSEKQGLQALYLWNPQRYNGLQRKEAELENRRGQPLGGSSPSPSASLDCLIRADSFIGGRR
jgi:hypothetical protein